jgi:Family of unknown function (DUF5681)
MRNAPAKRNRRDYEIGWGKPPKSMRWRPGQSGNPKGRPRAKKNQLRLFREALEQKIRIEERGKERTITIIEAIIKRFVSQALKGDLKAIKLVLDMMAEFPEPTPLPEKITADMSPEEIARTYFEMVKRVV